MAEVGILIARSLLLKICKHWKGSIMKSIKRRTFLAQTIAAAGGLSLACCSYRQARGEQTTVTRSSSTESSYRPNRIAVSTYSFWRFKRNLKLPIETCINEAAAMGFDGVEILHIQMEKESNDYLQSLKRRALINGIDLCGMSKKTEKHRPHNQVHRIGLQTRHTHNTHQYRQVGHHKELRQIDGKPRHRTGSARIHRG